MPRSRSFAVSTHLYHGQRLNRDHLREVAAAGFDAVELFATRTHFDYHSESATADLQGWLADARLGLASVHAPVAESFSAGRWGAPLNLASGDAAQRERALEEAMRALHIARRLPFRTLVAHMGVPRSPMQAPGSSTRDAARRSLEALVDAAVPLGVTIAVEVLANELSKAGSLVYFIENVLDAGAVSICLDLGHAHLEGDVVDVIETVSEHVALVHASDNRGRNDDHLLPFDGTIDWAAALTALQKVGYDGTVVLEPAPQGSTRDTLAKAQSVRAKMERLLSTF
ncbi:MAG TPA: sugar phosphate isomerase/epimerase family protein [Vicinamibacterales bacterium]|nr:sugar phosphate isomerase/epimerase family protein [Vicinamibacterales bacterium]